MSLQPLDATSDIPEAYKLALSESRRWVVLSYTSRSALSLKAQGIGLPDLRKQLEDEDEVLFGFLRFRRRGIVLQYTNPDCSRVVKARAQVHLQTILNFFRDNDFLLETSTPKDITLDNIARLTNSTSTSTINSNKKSKRLTDIMEESPIMANGEIIDDEQSSPEGSDGGNSITSSHKGQDEVEVQHLQPPPERTVKPPRNKLLLRPISPENTMLNTPPTTPRSPLPRSPLRRSPSPGSSPTYTKQSSTDFPRDSMSSNTSQSTPSEHIRESELTIDSSPLTPTPTPPPPNLPPTPVTPTPPEKLRLMKALEMRRQKMSGIPIIKTPKTDGKRTADDMNEKLKPTPLTPPELKPPSQEHKNRLLEAKRAALEAQRRHIASLEQSGRDLLSGWVNFQSSTSLLWRRKFIRITSLRELILAETEDNTTPTDGTAEKSTWRWKLNNDVRGVEIPDRDEEQLPHSIRIAAERGGAVCSIACQTAGDLTNLRRVLGYCLNDEGVFSG